MIEKFEDLGFDDIGSEDIEGPEPPMTPQEEAKLFLEEVDKILQAKLGLSLDILKQRLSEYTIANADELAEEFVNIAPNGDYSKLLEDNEGMAEFFKTEAHKPEHWRLLSISPHDVQKTLIKFQFANSVVDDGDVFDGFVYVSYQGKIKHAFTQGNDN